jgi:hypothetical protein
MSQLISLTPSGDPSGLDDRQAISESLVNAGVGGVVSLAPGQWWTDQALSIGLDGVELAGYGGGINGRTSRLFGRTVLTPASGFTGGEVIGIVDGVSGPAVTGIAIRGDANTPPDVDGIVCHGNVNAMEVGHVSVALLPGHGIAWFQVGGVDGGACKLDKVMIQQVGKNGVHRWPSDSTLNNVHTQYTGSVSGTYSEPLAPGTGHGFFSTSGSGGNTQLIGCRADLSAACGFVADHNGAFGDAMRLVGCGTERNQGHGLLVTNSSATGSDWRVPVIVSGCSFEGDGIGGGAGGEFAGICVEGRNQVFIDGTVVAVNNLDVPNVCPKYSLMLRQKGSNNAQPEIVAWSSGRLNYSLGQSGAAVLNPSFCDHLKFGPTLTQVGGYEGTSHSERSGTVTTSGRVATVNNPWVRSNSRIQLTPLSSGSGVCSVTSRSTGSFSVATGTADCTMAWSIV